MKGSVMTVKGNQPRLRARLKDLPSGHTAVQTGHGRRVRRTVKAVQVPDWVQWPGAAQVLQIRRPELSTDTRQSRWSRPSARSP